MRVLIVTNMYPDKYRPAFGSFVESQVESLKVKGLHIDVFYIRGYAGKLKYVTAIPQVIWKSLSGRYDIIHAHYGLCGLVARCQWRLPVVVSFCGDDLYGHADALGVPTRTSLFWVYLHRLLSRHVATVIVKSAAMKALLPECGARIVPNGVDFSLFHPIDRAQCRVELGLDNNVIYVLFPYRKDRVRKNYGLVEQAVAILNRERQPSAPRYEILVVDNQPNSRLPIFMNAADVLVLASYWEGSPNAVKEALACNLPIVATNVGDVAEMLDGVVGCSLTAFSAEALAQSIRRVLAEGPRTNGREQSARLRIERIADQLIEIYRETISNNQSPSISKMPFAGRSNR